MAHAIRSGALTRRALVTGLVAGACAAGARSVAAEPGEELDEAQAIEVYARALQRFRGSQPDVGRFGDLEFRGGLVLSSSSEHFGGSSTCGEPTTTGHCRLWHS